ncbi:hypothetical protein ACFWB2_39625 [Streptomyces virginiae]|uniref:hypothetical protein n=1 Tax=Streptomyces TaxID=1883 RepID=UPI0005261AE5|nr:MULTISPECIES: hypothetical protein [Streptomyces]MCX4717752.1 hypothetical protein [Streptomyces virginiae]MCX5277606.1 hypothetical protein [Streptomyces virginiae]MYV74987.1 hypothetical protein [Streptomyces sp. SID1046]WSC81290.1 hypothetical protein OHA56_35960 [Streptomyces virginiae]
MGTTLVVAAIVIAAVVVRTAVAELREPGSGRRQWSFLTDSRALTAGAITALVLGLLGWRHAGGEGVVWAGLAGILVAFAMGQGRRPR